MSWPENILIIFVLIATPLLLIVLPLYLLFGGLRRFARRPLDRCYDGIGLHDQLKPGDVSFVYHTYRGMLLWVTQDEHRVIAPSNDAERLLRRLLRYNLTWGLFSAVVYVPFLAIGNYVAQKRSIRRQVAKTDADLHTKK